jgi:hypothetical protein
MSKPARLAFPDGSATTRSKFNGCAAASALLSARRGANLLCPWCALPSSLRGAGMRVPVSSLQHASVGKSPIPKRWLYSRASVPLTWRANAWLQAFRAKTCPSSNPALLVCVFSRCCAPVWVPSNPLLLVWLSIVRWRWPVVATSPHAFPRVGDEIPRARTRLLALTAIYLLLCRAALSRLFLALAYRIPSCAGRLRLKEVNAAQSAGKSANRCRLFLFSFDFRKPRFRRDPDGPSGSDLWR